MKALHNGLIIFAFLIVCLLPLNLSASSAEENWTAGPWEPQEMISWGERSLIVDFGLNGLWNYDGSWIRLSRWNPEGMVVWGTNLTVDFGANGLWNYNGSSWIKLTEGNI